MKQPKLTVTQIVIVTVFVALIALALCSRANAFEYNPNADVMGNTSIRPRETWTPTAAPIIIDSRVLVAGVNKHRMAIVNEELDRVERALKTAGLKTDKKLKVTSHKTKVQTCHPDIGCSKWTELP